MLFVFSRLLPIAILIAAKVAIEGYVQNNLENKCFQLPADEENSNNNDNFVFNSISSAASSTLCKLYSTITVDEGRMPQHHFHSTYSSSSGAASIAEFPFWILKFIASTILMRTGNDNNHHRQNFFTDFFKYHEVPKYLDFYVTATLVVTTIFAAKVQSASFTMINLLPLAFWCLVGSHSINRMTSSYLVVTINNEDDNGTIKIGRASCRERV